MLNQIRLRSCGVEDLGRWVALVDNLRIGGLRSGELAPIVEKHYFAQNMDLDLSQPHTHRINVHVLLLLLHALGTHPVSLVLTTYWLQKTRGPKNLKPEIGLRRGPA